jgi:hypothetical protein
MIWQIIRTAMIRNDIKSIAELAEITGLKSSTLQHERRTNPGSFRLYELKQIADKLNLTNEERRQMI